MTDFDTDAQQFFQQSEDTYYDWLARTYYPNSKLYQTPPCSTPEEEPWYYGTPKHTFYSEVTFPTDQLVKLDFHQFNSMVEALIGKKGSNLIDITVRTRCHYIWYNNEKKTFQIWGDTLPCVMAQATLTKQIKDYLN